MTPAELGHALQEYRAGLEAELALLHQLERVSTAAVDPPEPESVTATATAADERERLMASLVSLEHQLRPLREVLAGHRDALRVLPLFGSVAALHREAGDLVARILASDSRSLEALRAAELARRCAATSVERGEATLAAYRRVVAPHHDGARIVNRRG
jgi:hypothetical protein